MIRGAFDIDGEHVSFQSSSEGVSLVWVAQNGMKIRIAEIDRPVALGDLEDEAREALNEWRGRFNA